MRQPKILTSYTHDTQAHNDAVLAMSHGLYSGGLDSHMGEVSPPEV